jgi:two-component system cell cycle sensor histidine kinase/response regulator CckA
MKPPGPSGSGEADASAWKANEPLFETIMRHAPMGFAFFDLEFRYRLINDKLAEINGLPAADHIGKTVAEVVPQLWPAVAPIMMSVRDTGHAIVDVEVSGEVPSTPGETRYWLEGFYPVRRDGTLVGIGVMAVELTEQKRAENDHRAILAAMPDLMFDLAADGTHLNFHAPREEALFVRPDKILGRRVREVLPAEVAALYERHIAATLESGVMQVFEYTLAYDAADKTFEARMVRKTADEVLVIVRDITERRRSDEQRRLLEEQFRQAQKMEAVGQLAGGVAHDFNNLLTVINAYSEMVLEALPDHDPSKALVAEVRKAGDRAGTLTRQLLLFSRQQVLEPKVLDLNAVIGESERMLRRLIGEDIEFKTQLDAGLGLVRVDPGQIEQALLNLSVNARDAMPTGGRLTVETRNVTIADGDAHARDGARPGDYSVIAVTDTGSGMDEATKSRLFEPFFTTKGPGKGTGLGLAVVFGVVKQSGGHIEVVTAPGLGTTFSLFFPHVAGADAADRQAPAQTAMAGGHETIMLVEDDPGVRMLARRVLERRGYTVMEATDGLEAVRALEAYTGPLHLVISDVVMPHFGGRQLAELVMALRPGVRVLFLSGYTDDAVVRHGVQGAEFAFLQKPFTPATLAAKVREVLDAPGQSPSATLNSSQ